MTVMIARNDQAQQLGKLPRWQDLTLVRQSFLVFQDEGLSAPALELLSLQSSSLAD